MYSYVLLLLNFIFITCNYYYLHYYYYSIADHQGSANNSNYVFLIRSDVNLGLRSVNCSANSAECG